MAKIEKVHLAYYCDVCGKNMTDPFLPEVWMQKRQGPVHSVVADKDICFDCLAVLQNAELMNLVYLPRDISLKNE